MTIFPVLNTSKWSQQGEVGSQQPDSMIQFIQLTDIHCCSYQVSGYESRYPSEDNPSETQFIRSIYRG